MEIDPRINLGHLLTMATTVACAFVATWKIISRQARNEMKVKILWRWFKKQHHMDNGDDDE